MEWLKNNAKKLGQLVVMALALAAGIAFLIPNCQKTGEALDSAKEKVEDVVPLLPGEELPK